MAALSLSCGPLCSGASQLQKVCAYCFPGPYFLYRGFSEDVAFVSRFFSAVWLWGFARVVVSSVIVLTASSKQSAPNAQNLSRSLALLLDSG